MQRNKIIAWSTAALTVSLSATYLAGHMKTVRAAAAAQASSDPVIYLNQGWSKADRDTYYWIPQGTVMMSYDIYQNLELADSQALFRSDANQARYGLIPSPPDPQGNPDGLPIGIAKETTTEGRWKGVYVGFNCAACHESELNYKGKRIRLDGNAGIRIDIVALYHSADDAMQATLHDSAKFDRLAAKIGATSSDAKSELRKRFENEADRIHYYINTMTATPHPWGPGRMDALSLINSRQMMAAPNIPENWFPALAPTKPPFLWNAAQGNWTQWSAEVQDSIQRNYSESTGVYLPMDLTSKTPQEGLFDSNARLLNLEKIEELMYRLAPPKWPEEIFGKIDRAKAAQGKVLFASHCAQCHNSYPYTWTEPNKYGKRFIEVGVVPQSYVGTDPMQFENSLPYVLTKQLAPYMPEPFKDQPLVPMGVEKMTITLSLLATAEKKLNLTPEETVKLHGYRELPMPPRPERSYKAAPRDGVWAEGPYMHNGSVPNLYEMLIPAKERTKKFYVGQEFDPVKVGVDTSGNSGKFLVDTTFEGNSNQGHSFESGPLGNGIIGPLLTDQQRWALVEYLKSIPEVEGRVTPFGGPPDAKSGHVMWEGPTRK
jgi:mono/diheme cytochrome c family protein